MKARDCIDIFPLELLQLRPDLKQEVLSAVDRFTPGIGWHYLLDLTWLLQEVEALPKGSLILDAGAGNGLMQLLLAMRGYKVLSVDFAPRRPSEAFRSVADIRIFEDRTFSNEYITHLKQTYNMAETCDATNEASLRECLNSDADIVYWRADLSDLSALEDNAVDSVVSVSALEHNSPEGMAACARELERVLKPGGAMHVTISGSDREDWFHEPSRGWCYCEQSIIDLFRLKSPESNFGRASDLFEELRQGDGLREHLAPFYFQSGNNGMPWGRWDPQYFPLGVRKCKA
ncbi:class I SAM-dependent methyltransferase [Pseudodesulfovibrio tunisiensis]|uniref:class I SAM-dependent methyltransferase n=1 Tax=Pseudodesulfovibrio tunisiensis TaxID=463192 RepID=UPI001FB4A5E4|nr:class I SAM-dependent methyltransferase [Pseudodesulfovibrio tunisiensis]